MMDSILFWNAVALEANRVSFSDPAKAEQQGPTLSSRALAIVHLAMYDAYARIENNAANFPLFLPAAFMPTVPPIAPVGKDQAKKQAVAGAAYTTLLALYMAQKDFFDSQVLFFETNFSAPVTNPNAPATPFQLGVVVGNELLRLRRNDPGAGADGYMVSMNRGRHRVDPDNPNQGFHAPFYGLRSKVFSVSKRYSLNYPPFSNGSDPKYKKALRQVRAKGIKPELMATLPSALFDKKRDAEESVIGVYWAYDGANRLGTPPRQYNQIIRQVALNKTNQQGQINNEGDNAKLFAFVNAAMGDAGILAWEQKYCHDFWRPVVGIREHDPSFGPKTMQAKSDLDDDADPFWLPLGAPSTNNPTLKNMTPNFPAYPSGHATFGAAAFHITRLFYGKGQDAGGTAIIPGGKKIIKNGNLVDDDLFAVLGFVSDEFNGMNQDNLRTVRPRHVRSFDLVNTDKPSSGGLGKMIIENARSRIYLGVHWIFDAFLAKPNSNLSKEIDPDFSANSLEIGGVPLGLKIAEDIFKTGGGKAPKMTSEEPNTQPSPSPEIMQPAKAGGCIDEPTIAKTKKAKDEPAAQAELPQQTEDQKVETPFLGGTSQR
jgi:vanadium chloroperoxidase